jgi:hypothetical protein
MNVFGTVSASTTLMTARGFNAEKISGGGGDFGVGHGLRERNHQIDVALGDRSLPRAAPEVRHLLHEVSRRLTRKIRVLGPARPVRAVTESAREHVGLAALAQRRRAAADARPDARPAR